MMLEVKVLPSRYSDGRKISVTIDGVEIAASIAGIRSAKRVQEALDEQARVESLAKAQAISYQLMNQRLTETVQAMQRVLVLGVDKLPTVEPIALDEPNYDNKGEVE